MKTAAENQIDFQGIPVKIEEPKGSIRKGVDPEGKAWEKEMRCDYGSIPNTSGAGDGERVDVYLGENPEAEFAYVVEQVGPTGKFDEYKVMLGFPTLEDAEEMYDYQGPTDWDGLGEIYEVPLSELSTAVQQHKAANAEIIERFCMQYERQLPLYSKAAAIVRDELTRVCAEKDIRCAVTSRGKGVESLRAKLTKRDALRPYNSIKDILFDIKDLAGVRVALYFPIDRQPVGEMILNMWPQARPPKEFPQDAEPDEPEGYEASHFAIKFAGLVVEVQVASALMYAWSEVAHDLIYKPRMGQLTQEEYQLLDDLKQIVSAGEHTVTSLQDSLSSRMASVKSSSHRIAVLRHWTAILSARLKYMAGDRE